MTTHGSDRDQVLDAARAVFMLLGVVFHSALLYSPKIKWIFSDPEPSPALGFLASALSTFRMPAFFWIAGYFCARTFMEKGRLILLRHRLKRLLIPFVATYVCFNTVQDSVACLAAKEPLSVLWQRGVSVGHLWFILYLMLYTILFAPALPILKLVRRHLNEAVVHRWHWSFVVLAGAVFVAVVMAAVRVPGQAIYIGVPLLGSAYNFCYYATFFMVGMICNVLPSLYRQWLTVPPWLFMLAIPAAVWMQPWPRGADSFLVREAAFLVHTCLVFAASGSIFNVLRRGLGLSPKQTNLLSESSYTIYLVHHLFVVAFGVYFAGYHIGPLAKFGLVVSLSFLLSGGFYTLLVRRHAVFSTLFGGPARMERRVRQV